MDDTFWFVFLAFVFISLVILSSILNTVWEIRDQKQRRAKYGKPNTAEERKWLDRNIRFNHIAQQISLKTGYPCTMEELGLDPSDPDSEKNLEIPDWLTLVGTGDDEDDERNSPNPFGK